ncbi:MAG: ATP-binding cassette domain-containing protein [Clostridiales bacterium]|nr:ATP-binding cassette domain-containing protein [Candidatus Coliplasma caballi]
MIEIEHLTKVFGTTKAVDDVTFRVEEGEIMGFLGPNGAGKSTTMNILTGYLSATSGTCRVNGVDILENPLEAKRNIGFLPELPPLYMEMTVKEYLDFIYDLKGCTFPKTQHIKEICDVVKLGDVYNRLIGNLSKGYKQRVGIAQALVGNPRVLIFDEPTVGLDPKQIIDIRNLIRMLGREHTIILSTHILPEVQAVCDRIVVINKGKLVANEKTEDLVTAVDGSRKMIAKIVGPEEEVVKALGAVAGIRSVSVLGKRDTDSISYLVESEDRVDARKPLFYTLASKGWPLVGLEGMELSLEDIFIRLVSDQKKNARNRKGGEN